MTRRLCFALDLQDDPALIQEYVQYHERVWPEVLASLREAGIVEMEIYLVEARLFLVMEVDETFSLERKAAADAVNPRVQAWEAVMWTYQRALPGTPPGQKWRLMERVFALPRGE
jgi:L-rhamnose mutarotase